MVFNRIDQYTESTCYLAPKALQMFVSRLSLVAIIEEGKSSSNATISESPDSYLSPNKLNDFSEDFFDGIIFWKL